MERIAKWLFVSTALTIFYFILTYSFVNIAGNGGEYWGFDGHEMPTIVAARSFESGDYRFLALDLVDSYGNRVREIPELVQCDNIDPGVGATARLNHAQALHGHDSVRLASEFAREYNDYMRHLIYSEVHFKCELSTK